MSDISIDQDHNEEYRQNVTEAHRALNDSHDSFGILQAQVHATLALAAAVRELDLSVERVGRQIKSLRRED